MPPFWVRSPLSAISIPRCSRRAIELPFGIYSVGIYLKGNSQSTPSVNIFDLYYLCSYRIGVCQRFRFGDFAATDANTNGFLGTKTRNPRFALTAKVPTGTGRVRQTTPSTQARRNDLTTMADSLSRITRQV
jgi:hypothetical protein